MRAVRDDFHFAQRVAARVDLLHLQRRVGEGADPRVRKRGVGRAAALLATERDVLHERIGSEEFRRLGEPARVEAVVVTLNDVRHHHHGHIAEDHPSPSSSLRLVSASTIANSRRSNQRLCENSPR